MRYVYLVSCINNDKSSLCIAILYISYCPALQSCNVIYLPGLLLTIPQIGNVLLHNVLLSVLSAINTKTTGS